MVSGEISRFLLLLVLCLCQQLVVGNGIDGRKTFIVRVDSNSKPTVFPTDEHWYRSTIATAVKAALKTESGSHMDALPLHVYNTVLHGFSARLTDDEAARMVKMPGILAMFPDRVRQLHTTRSPGFLGLDTPNGSGLWADSDYGSDVVIGFLDTGIWPERRSFSDQGMGPVPKHWKGECESGSRFPKTLCNRKLVGARFSHEGYKAMYGTLNETLEFRSARDSEGHGTHTASTAAGRYVEGANMMGYAQGIAKGIAPQARIAVYKVCWAYGCLDSDILFALDKAVDDGVDVLSLSIGGAAYFYDLDIFAIGTFEAVKRGVFVSASAGNAGPIALSVANVAPWITTVGAGTLDRDFPANIQLGNGAVIHGVSLYSGKGLNARRLLPLVDAGDAAEESNNNKSLSSLCKEGSLDPKKVTGKIVLCERGDNPRVAKGAVVKQAGGVGMILSNTASDGEGLIPDAHLLPADGVGSSAGNSIRSYIKSTKNPTATIIFHGTQLGVKPAPVVASFSSRGPNPVTPEILKPDIIAPGVGILAAWTDAVGPSDLSFDHRRTEFNIISGTSMSCPHVSGIAALLKGEHPDWSPAAIKSAIMTTAYTYDTVNKREVPMGDEATGKASTPFGFGAGHVDPQRATAPGLIYDLGVNDYVNFLCSLNYSQESIKLITNMNVSCPTQIGQPGNLNYPSFSAVFDQGQSSNLSTSFMRTVTIVGPTISTYTATVITPTGIDVTVEPPLLKFSKRHEKLSFTLRVSAQPLKFPPKTNSDTVFGSLGWSDGKHVVRSPIAITRKQS